MDEGSESSSPATVPESPKPLAFTIDFGSNKAVDTQRQKALVEKLKNRHKRGQSLSKLEDSTTASTPPAKQHPLTGNLPRKSSFQSEGYFSSDEKNDRAKSARSAVAVKRSELTLLLKNVTSDRMTQSFPNPALPSITSPEEEIELKDVSSPELDLISPFSPREQSNVPTNITAVKKTLFSSPECEKLYIGDDDKDNVFVDGTEMDFDKSDTVSDTGTYTLDADNYSEEQKARMSIDRDFKIEHVSVQKKTEEYVRSLSAVREQVLKNAATVVNRANSKESEVTKGVQALNLLDSSINLKSPNSPTARKFEKLASATPQSKPVLSPIMSPTQNISITQSIGEDADKTMNNGECDVHNKTFTKIMFPSSKAKQNGLEQAIDQGSVISVTSSGAFKPKIEKKYERKYSLSKSEVQVQAYIDGKNYTDGIVAPVQETEVMTRNRPKLTANIVNVQSIEVKKPNATVESVSVVNSANNVFEKVSNISPVSCQTVNLPPAVGGYSGKSSPTKIPSPIHTISRPRSRNSSNSLNVEFSDSNLDTDLILKPTQNYINSLQQRLSLDSDPDSDYDSKYGIQLNNTAHLLKQKASHTRHNSLDDRAMNISNKLEHFQNKNLQGIDQTYTNLFNQYSQNKVIQKIQNSPNNSPIKRSSSFSNKNQINSPKNTNVVVPQKESNLCNSPNLTRSSSIQRSSSTVCIKPNYIANRRPSTGEYRKSGQYGDTESSSEEDFEKNMQKRKDLANITNTRCNRAFSLRRARIDNEPSPLKCPNTPEMRRKTLHPDMKQERAISVDRKPMKTNDVQSRYLLNIAKKQMTPVAPSAKLDVKSVPKVGSATKSTPNRPQVFSRTDSGRFSMRTTTKPPPTNNTPKGFKKDGGKKQGGGRSNSSLSSREVEFQNWKRRKSYDPMKAAAEGKKKEIAKRQSIGQNAMTQSYIESNNSQDSSPSHSSSVHRSQSFHGTAALEQLMSSEDEEDLTLSADEGFSPPTPSPCELSPARASLRLALWERIRH